MLRAKAVQYPSFIPRDKYEMLIEGEREEYMGKPPKQETRMVKTLTRTKIYHARCSICNLKEREQIDTMLNDGKSLDDIVETFEKFPIIRKFLSEHIAAGHLEKDDDSWIFWYFADNIRGGKIFVHWSKETQSFFVRT